MPEIISVNGIETDFSDIIFTYYKNNLGKQYYVNIGEELAYNKQYILVANDESFFTVSRADGSEIKIAEINDGVISDDCTILSSGDSFYIKGNLKNQTANLYIYAYGTLGFSNPLVRTIELTTYLGSQNVIATDFTTLNGQVENTYFVEVGNTFTLNYAIDSNSSARGIKLLGLDENPLQEYLTVSVGEGNYPIINVTALKQGKLTCKLVLDNLVESNTFTIWSFVSIDYEDKGGYALSVDSPLVNRYVAEARYDVNKSLESFVMSLGTGVQMYISTNPGNATIYGIKYESVIIEDGIDENDASEYFVVNQKSGFIIAKKYYQQDESHKTYIKVTVSSLHTNYNGDVELITDGIKYVSIESYVPLTNVTTSKSDLTLYWKDNLNPIQVFNGVYKDSVSLRLDPISINREKLRIKWDAGANIQIAEDSNGLNCVLSAISAPEETEYKSIYTLTITINYYSTTIVKRVSINVIKPIWASTISAYIDDDYDNSTAYFDVHEYGDNYADVPKIKIHSKVFSASGEDNVTFTNVNYVPFNKTIASVSADGYITPLSVGSTDIMVFSDDMASAESTPGNLVPIQYKVIHVVVADGMYESSALRIRTEEEFSQLLQENENYSQSIQNINENEVVDKISLYYYLASDISLKSNKNYFATNFYDNLDGRGHNLDNLSLAANGALFGDVKSSASLKNLNVYANLETELLENTDYKFAGISYINDGVLKNIAVYFINADVIVKSVNVESLSVAGLTNINNKSVEFCSVSMNLNITSNYGCSIGTLMVGGLVGENNKYIQGLNENYNYRSGTTQEFEFDGKISIGKRLSVGENSAIGAICAVNGAQGVIGAWDYGVAVDASINAERISNVGGIAGINSGRIQNSLSKISILAKNNVGGIAGVSNSILATDIGINNTVVELYQDVIDLDNFAQIIGDENVGGIVGLLSGNLTITHVVETIEDEDNPDADPEIEEYDIQTTKYSKLANSYVKAYGSDCLISGNANVGGLAGQVLLAEIKSCYAQVNLCKFDSNNVQIAEMHIAGGIAGLIEKSSINKAYYVGKIEGSTKGAISAIVTNSCISIEPIITTINQFYSSVELEFIASGDEADYVITDSHKYDEDLKDISIYENWMITQNESDIYSSGPYDWLIDASKNNGYPQLIYNNNIMHKLMPNDIFINVRPEATMVNDAVLVYTNENNVINDIIDITTDVNTRATIYVFSDVNDVLLPSSSNKLGSKTYLRSSTSQVVTLTFVLGNNPNVRKSIQVIFVDKVLALKVDDVKIKNGASDTISAKYSKRLNKEDENVFELLSGDFYKLGIDFNEDFNEENPDGAKLKIYNSEIVEIDGTNVILFDNNAILKGLDSISKQYVVKLYQKVVYTDLMEEQQPVYIETASYSLFNVDVYSGASSISATNTKIDMTLIEDVTFDVILKTDRQDDKIIVTLNSTNVYVDERGFEDLEDNSRIVLSTNSETETNKEDAKLILSVLNISPSIKSKGEMIVTFNLKFNEKYFNASSSESMFNQIFSFGILFTDIESNVSTRVDVTAKPQRLLKIDVVHYSTGRVEGEKYTVTSALNNSLTPGQTGLIVIDIYPEYSQFDQIILKSGTDNNGNRISFIQVAKYYDTYNSEEMYLELRPSAVVTEDGIILQRISNITRLYSDGAEEFSFDGKFYAKTLMGTNVDFDQLISVTVIGVSSIKDENGNVESYEVSRPIDIIVNQAPLVKLEYNGQIYKKFIRHEVEENGKVVNKEELFNLVTAGQSLEFDISYYKLSLSNLDLKIKIYDINTGNVIDNSISRSYWSAYFTSNKLVLNISDDCPSGVRIEFSVTGEEFINDYKETYESNSYEFVVVDYIIKGIEVNSGNYSFIVGDITPVTASLSLIKGAKCNDEYMCIQNLQNEINYNYKYWSNASPNDSGPWSLQEYYFKYNNNGEIQQKISDNKRVEFSFYDVYGIPYPDKDNTLGYRLNIYAKKQTGDASFKVVVPYFYDFTYSDNGLFGGINLNIDETVVQYNEDLQKVVTMNLKTVTNIDDPIPVYTISEFYKMQENADLDYILMDDLHFGVTEEMIPNNWEPGTYTTEAYTPFALNVKSFDGNTNTIEIYDNINIPSDETNLGLFTSIGEGTILVNLRVNYKARVGEYAISLQLDNDNSTSGGATTNAQSITFGGLAAVNNGVVSNCIVVYSNNVIISLTSGESEVNIAGLISQNSGKITYSSVFGPNWNDNFNANIEQLSEFSHNICLETSNTGSLAAFVNRNSDLISNCQAEFVGLRNTAHASLDAKVGGFATTNSGRIISSSVAGQRLKVKLAESASVDDALKAVCKNDERVSKILKNEGLITTTSSDTSQNGYFARIYSQSNIGGFIYSNSGSINDSYTYIPMETQARTAGFVYDNSNGGNISTSYSYSIYDGAIGDNFANSPFVGTNELGEVLNDSENSNVNYCYYMIPVDHNYKSEIINAEPASGIALGEVETADGEGSGSSVVMDSEDFVGFDFGESDNMGIWIKSTAEYDSSVILINSNVHNNDIWEKFRRYPIEGVENKSSGVGIFTLKFPRAASEEVPYTIANELQFVNTFTIESIDGVLTRDIRMINDIDFADYAGTDELNNIKNTIYAGRDFDGNGMKIQNIKLTGGSSSNGSSNTSAYSIVSNSYGLFYQIGTASEVNDDGERTSINFDPEQKEHKTIIRNLTLGVKEISNSTSAFTGILAGVVVNSSIKSLTINAAGVNVTGKNAVGGVAGAVIGSSVLHNISVNANVSSTYLQYSNNTYTNKNQSAVDKYQCIDYEGIDNAGVENKDFDLLDRVSKCSYAGGIAGIIDINAPLKSDSSSNTKALITDSSRASNCRLLKVYGDIVISGEIVGGIAGKINKDTFIESTKFELSDVNNDSQRLFGFYTSGGLVGINDMGAIYLSSVEMSNNSYKQNDLQLTNKSGLSLFRSDAISNPNSNINVYPYAIGGLVGIERGGYIISSFSKTNVINFNAKFAGGIAGYLQSVDSNYIGSHPLFAEVYTTGNVAASNRYSFKKSNSAMIDYAQKADVYRGTGSINDASNYEKLDGIGNRPSVKIMTPEGYSGGIAGGYEASALDQFNGVDGINAFHQPKDYVTQYSNYLPVKLTVEDGKTYLEYNRQNNTYTTQNLTYSDSANGYFGVRYLSNSEPEVVYFEARIGAIFGYVNYDGLQSETNKTIRIAPNTSVDKHSNLFTKFAYNSVEITASDCNYLNGGNGKEIGYIAKDNINEYNTDSKIVNSPYETETHIDFYVLNSTRHIYLNCKVHNKSSGENEIVTEQFTYAETYLVLRGLDLNSYKYSELKPNSEGVYQYWSDDWVFEYPVYPAIKPSSITFYIDIKTEEDLLNMSSGSKYRLMNDIYLSDYWTPMSRVNLTLISGNRKDDRGLTIYDYKESDGKFNKENYNPHYVIYNVNIMSDDNSVSSGFFKDLSACRIENITFVYGTTFDDPAMLSSTNSESLEEIESIERTWKGDATGKLGYICSTNDLSNKNGLLVGELLRGSVINNCKVILNTEVESRDVCYDIEISKNTIGDIKNIYVGGLIGWTGESKTNRVYNSSVYMSNVVLTDGRFSNKVAQPYDGYKAFEVKLESGNGIGEVFVGGIAGFFDASKANGFEGNNVNNLKINVSTFSSGSESGAVNILTSFNLGGLVGKIQSGNGLNSNKVYGINLNVSNLSIKESSSDSTLIPLNIGGLAGSSSSEFTNSVVILKGINVSNVKNGTSAKSELSVGGFVGKSLNNSTVRNSYVDKYKKFTSNTDYTELGIISADNIEVTSLNAGGFAGYMSESNVNCAKSNVTINVGGENESNKVKMSAQSHIAGFVGIAKGESKFEYCLSSGKISIKLIELPSDNKYVYVSGFAGAGTEASNNTTRNSIIDSVVANVKIEIQTNHEYLRLSGFAGDYFSKITNSVSIGDIEYIAKEGEQQVGREFLGKAAGFTVDDLENLCSAENKPNFSLSTLRLVGENIRPASFNSKHIIYYSYNLSGVMHKYEENSTDKTLPYITGNRYCCTYDELLVSKSGKIGIMARNYVARVLANSSDNNMQNFFKNEYKLLCTGGRTSGIGGENYGTKLYPYLTDDIGDASKNIEGIYFFIREKDTAERTRIVNIGAGTDHYDITSNTIRANIICNSHNIAVTFNLSSPISIAQGAFISGVEFATNDDVRYGLRYFIETNNGYIFNCLTTGRIKAQSLTENMSGFINKNVGIVNASLSMAFIDANNQSATTAGFVLKNSGIIMNSAATNEFFNIKNSSDVSHSGFVFKNYDNSINGKIKNCFASGAMFDVELNQDIASEENFANTYDFYAAADGIDNNADGFANCHYDRYSNSHGSTSQTAVTEQGHYTSITKTVEMFVRYDWRINYNYGTPTSFENVTGNIAGSKSGATDEKPRVKTSGGGRDIATYFTGDDTTNNPLLVNNIGRFWSLFDRKNDRTCVANGDYGITSSNSIYLRLLNNLNGAHWTTNNNGDVKSFNGKLAYNNNSTISINNTEVFALYNIIVNTEAKDNRIGLLSAETVNLTNFGVVGKFDVDSKDCSGGTVAFVVPYANTATISGSYAILTDKVTLSNASYYGTMLGLCDGPDVIKYSFAYGDVQIDSAVNFVGSTSSGGDYNTAGAVGVTGIGMFEGRGWQSNKWTNCFAGGSITISDAVSASTHIAGFCGYTSVMEVDKLYSAVSIVNKTCNLSSDFVSNLDAIVNDYQAGAKNWSDDVYYDEYLSLQTSTQVGNKRPTSKKITELIGLCTDRDLFYDSWTTDYGNHLPIPKSFTLDACKDIVYTRLNLSDSQKTGSRLSPKEVSVSSSSFDNDKDYYYLSKDDNISAGLGENTKFAMMIGDRYKLTNNQVNCTNVPGAFNFAEDYDCIISGVITQDAPISKYFGGYAYKCFAHWTGAGEHNYSYGFMDEVSANSIFDGCGTQGSLTFDMSKVRDSGNSFRFVSAFVWYAKATGTQKGVYRNLDIDVNITVIKNTDKWDEVSGVFGSYYSDYHNVGSDINKIRESGGYLINCNISVGIGESENSIDWGDGDKNGLIFGALAAHYNKAIEIDGTANQFTIDIKGTNFYGNTYIGGVYGEIKYYVTGVIDPIISFDTITVNMSSMTSENIQQKSLYFAVGGFAGHISGDYQGGPPIIGGTGTDEIATITGDYWQLSYQSNGDGYLASNVYYGGVIGWMECGSIQHLESSLGTNISGGKYIGFTSELYQNESNHTIACVGGIVGYSSCDVLQLTHIDCKSEINAASACEYGNSIRIENATNYTNGNYSPDVYNITLAVGGIVGKANKISCTDVQKSSGDVTGKISSPISSTTGSWGESYVYTDYTDTPQTRVGGLAGIVNSFNTDRTTKINNYDWVGNSFWNQGDTNKYYYGSRYSVLRAFDLTQEHRDFLYLFGFDTDTVNNVKYRNVVKETWRTDSGYNDEFNKALDKRKSYYSTKDYHEYGFDRDNIYLGCYDASNGNTNYMNYLKDWNSWNTSAGGNLNGIKPQKFDDQTQYVFAIQAYSEKENTENPEIRLHNIATLHNDGVKVTALQSVNSLYDANMSYITIPAAGTWGDKTSYIAHYGYWAYHNGWPAYSHMTIYPREYRSNDQDIYGENTMFVSTQHWAGLDVGAVQAA